MKETKLKDSAAIYNHNEYKSEKQKWNELTLQQKIIYFKDYYLKKLIIICLLAAFTIYLVYTMLSPKNTPYLYAAVLNDYLDLSKTDQLVNEFYEEMDLDPENQEVMIDSNFILSGDAGTDMAAAEQKLAASVYSQQIDIIIADKTDFEKYVKAGYLGDISDYIPTDLYSQLADSLYFGTNKETNLETAYGINLSQETKFSTLGSLIKEPVIGIVANSKHKENAAEFIQFLYDK